MTWEELLSEIYKGEKIDIECKKATSSVPDSVYETYCAFANTSGGVIILGIEEDKAKSDPSERFIIRGVNDVEKLRQDFWNTINSKKVNANILVDADVYPVIHNDIKLLVIHVPKADYTMRPVYKGENPFKGTFKRNHEGDYHAKEYEVRALIRDQSSEGSDSTILEGFTMDDIDAETLKQYRIMFNNFNPDHVWRQLPDQEFLEMLGGYRRNRRDKIEGLTTAGLMMFGSGLAIRDEFDNIFMDYRDETGTDSNIRWIDRITYDGTWENNLFNFFRKVMPKLTESLKRPFVLNADMQRVDDTSVHRAIREAFVNMMIHADYRMDAGVLRIIKRNDTFIFSNPGNLKISKEQIYRGGESKARNPHMQTMLRMVGFGDNAGSGFPDILSTWAEYGWEMPELVEDTFLNTVTLTLKIQNRLSAVESAEEAPKSAEEASKSAEEAPKSAEDEKILKLTYQQQQVYDLVMDKENITTVDVMLLLGIKERRAREILKEMVDMNVLKKQGATSSTRYSID